MATKRVNIKLLTIEVDALPGQTFAHFFSESLRLASTAIQEKQDIDATITDKRSKSKATVKVVNRPARSS